MGWPLLWQHDVHWASQLCRNQVMLAEGRIHYRLICKRCSYLPTRPEQPAFHYRLRPADPKHSKGVDPRACSRLSAVLHVDSVGHATAGADPAAGRADIWPLWFKNRARTEWQRVMRLLWPTLLLFAVVAGIGSGPAAAARADIATDRAGQRQRAVLHPNPARRTG